MSTNETSIRQNYPQNYYHSQLGKEEGQDQLENQVSYTSD